MIGNYLSMCIFGITACLFIGTVEAIVGGRPVNNSHQFPFQVSVQNDLHHHICGGGLFTEEIVLTSANCLVNRNGQFIIQRYYVLAGTTDLRQIGSPAQIVGVEKAIVPRDFNNVSPRYDIAVLKLTRRLVHPTRPYDPDWLRWPWSDESTPLSTGIIAGFGLTRFNVNNQAVTGNSLSYRRLKYASSRILPHEDCQRAFSHMTIDNEFNFCARVEAASTLYPYGVCYGDPGGLLVHGGDEHTALLGVLSRNSPNCDEEQGRGRPALYVRAAHFQRFISNAANQIYRSNHVISYPL